MEANRNRFFIAGPVQNFTRPSAGEGADDRSGLRAFASSRQFQVRHHPSLGDTFPSRRQSPARLLQAVGENRPHNWIPDRVTRETASLRFGADPIRGTSGSFAAIAMIPYSGVLQQPENRAHGPLQETPAGARPILRRFRA